MLLLLCWICPPLAVLFSGRPFAAVGNIFLTMFFWLPGVYHALAVVDNRYRDKRTDRLCKSIDGIRGGKQPGYEPVNPLLVLLFGPLAWLFRKKVPVQQVQSRRCAKLQEPQFNDPRIGVHGTRFRSRNK